jgi:uncharacterized protein (TIGR02391 family)
MDVERAIELLKQKSKEAIHIANQPYNGNESVLWRRNIEDILESAFGVTSTEYKRIADVRFDAVRGTRIEVQRNYMRRVHRLQQEVDSIIQKHEILGIETEPAKNTEQKDTTKSPIQLFDSMKFHPKLVEASKSCFTATNYREAILNAFISLIDYIKEISKLDLDGDKLMNAVFSFDYDKEHRKITRYPLIRINELKNQTDRDEQQGFMFLCKGAAAFIRNPKAHKLIAQTNPLHILEHLAFASLLFRQLDKGIQTYQKERPF